MNLCSCMQMMSWFDVSADAIISGILPSLFNVWTFRVPMVFSLFPFSSGVLVVADWFRCVVSGGVSVTGFSTAT